MASVHFALVTSVSVAGVTETLTEFCAVQCVAQRVAALCARWVNMF